MFVKTSVLQERERLEQLLHYEKEIWQNGITYIAGIDEAGRGPLAGPVIAAAVIMPQGVVDIAGLNDSKKLAAGKRLKIETEIKKKAICYAIASASPAEIDELNILQATKLAMQRAVCKLKIMPQHLLLDAVKLQETDVPQTALIKGDSLSASIAAASIIAKCSRDKIMVHFDKIYPQYGFAKHKGYPTPEHYKALKIFGPCPIHRTTFRLK